MINRIVNCIGLSKVSIYGDTHSLDNVYKKIGVQYVSCLEDVDLSSFIFMDYESNIENRDIVWINGHRFDCNILIHCSSNVDTRELEKLGKSYSLNMFGLIDECVFLFGKCFEYDFQLVVPDDFKVLAIMHVFNEADIVEETIKHLICQNIDVYVVDNWSNDGSYEIVKALQMQYPNRLFLERFPEYGVNEYYDWYHQLERTEQINRNSNYNWFIHYDADEIRLSPWKNVSLRDAIFYVDKLGYNLIENTVIDFKITEDSPNCWVKDGWFDFGHRKGHFEQVKTWKRDITLDLKKSGGHIAEIENPRIFPLKILNRHYPLRTIDQARKKIYRDRLPRFAKEKNERGWHGHYDKYMANAIKLENARDLIRWDEDTFFQYYISLILGVGISREPSATLVVPDYNISENEAIIIYGAGNIGQALYECLVEKQKIVLWADKKYNRIPRLYGEKIVSPTKIVEENGRKIIIAIENEIIANEIKRSLVKMGVKGDIVWKNIYFQK